MIIIIIIIIIIIKHYLDFMVLPFDDKFKNVIWVGWLDW